MLGQTALQVERVEVVCPPNQERAETSVAEGCLPIACLSRHRDVVSGLYRWLALPQTLFPRQV